MQEAEKLQRASQKETQNAARNITGREDRYLVRTSDGCREKIVALSENVTVTERKHNMIRRSYNY